MSRRYTHRRSNYQKRRTPEEIANQKEREAKLILRLAEEKAASQRQWKRVKRVVLLCVLIWASFKYGPILRDGLTPHDMLFERYKSERLNPDGIRSCIRNSRSIYRIGAICSDGSVSRATGRGACSHHHGVAQWIMDTVYTRNEASCRELIIQQCQKDAFSRSWR